MPYDDLRDLEAKPIPIPVRGMEPAQVSIQFPVTDGEPSPLQLDLLERIRQDFPRIWEQVINSLQREYGRQIPEVFDPVQTFSWVGVLIPPWEDTRDGVERGTPIKPSVENFRWEMGIDHSAIPDCSGIEVDCHGLNSFDVTLHW